MFLGTICAPEMALAQLGPRAPAASTSTATQLPLSGRSANSGSVATTQTPIPGATTSVNTINSTVQVSGQRAQRAVDAIHRQAFI
jgi:Leucine-rich repeat (LRR) protein